MDNKLTHIGMQSFSRALRETPRLKHLDLSANQGIADLGTQCIVSALIGGSRLETLCLERCNIGYKAVSPLSKILVRSSIRVLKVSENPRIGPPGLTLLGHALAGSPVEEFYAASVTGKDMGCKAIVEGLLRNSRLKVLDLRDNQITNEGAVALASVLGIVKLERLILDENAIMDRGVETLANSITGSMIVELGLEGNKVEEVGENALKKAYAQVKKSSYLIIMTKRKELHDGTPFTVSVPCSTANLGPGFDVLGCGLGMRMSVTCTFPESDKGLTVSYNGDSPHTVPLDPSRNLITRTAIQTAASFGQLLPTPMHVAIENPIPLGRGLGSSGTAVVAGVVLANESLGLGMDTQRILDYCLAIEGHPDNITASILGGFVASYKREHPDPAPPKKETIEYKQNYSTLYPDVPDFEAPPCNLGKHLRLKVSPKIKFVVTIPEFELQTKLARSVLPQEYPKADVIYNLQRLAVLVSTLTSDDAKDIDPAVISEAMHDRVHQKYRQHLVPGLPEILSLSYKTLPGLLGVCVSGAGPTVLCLATDNFEKIGQTVVDIFGKHSVDEAPGYEKQKGVKGSKKVGIKASFKVLEVSAEGFTVSRG
ncbi:hypothetical protein HDU79_004451 [Rhizoclosmatium sp. JEL0117]|nr:hypothetical protein HDU79_004451 [Rhizoclosmatium sp. JEL0117]